MSITVNQAVSAEIEVEMSAGLGTKGAEKSQRSFWALRSFTSQ